MNLTLASFSHPDDSVHRTAQAVERGLVSQPLQFGNHDRHLQSVEDRQSEWVDVRNISIRFPIECGQSPRERTGVIAANRLNLVRAFSAQANDQDRHDYHPNVPG